MAAPPSSATPVIAGMNSLRDAMPLSILCLDSDLVVRFANHECLAQAGRAARGVVGRHIAEVMGPSYAHFEEPLRRSLAGETVAYATRFSDGGVDREVRVNQVPTGASPDRVTGVALVIEDVTQPLLIEKQARQREREREDADRIRNEMLQKLVAADEAQRSEIARDLHDHMGQQLTAIMLTLSDLARRLPGPAEQERVGSLQAIASAMGRDLHALTLRLRPTSLDDLGVVQSVAHLVNSWSISANLKADFHARGFGRERVEPQLETTIFRIVEAALTNVRKHARASSVAVVLQRDPGEVSIVIEDDGAGFDVDALGRRPAGERLGILGMNGRVALLGGQFAVESQPGKGTTVIARLPIGTKGGTNRA